ncbi:MAG: hypothetical protein IKZ88_00335, partial [Neisseriaceae bacterium]|nr:hypothetical protein [Neisseriaceae bacterium]
LPFSKSGAAVAAVAASETSNAAKMRFIMVRLQNKWSVRLFRLPESLIDRQIRQSSIIQTCYFITKYTLTTTLIFIFNRMCRIIMNKTAY